MHENSNPRPYWRIASGAKESIVAAVPTTGIRSEMQEMEPVYHIQGLNQPNGSLTLCGELIPWNMVVEGIPFRAGGKAGSRLVFLPPAVTCFACQLRYAEALYDPLSDAASQDWLDATCEIIMRNIQQRVTQQARTHTINIKYKVEAAASRLHERELQVLDGYWKYATREAWLSNPNGWIAMMEVDRVSALRHNGRAPF